MASEHVRTKYTKAQVAAIIRNGIAACNGRGPDTYGFARVFKGAIVYSIFSSVHSAFLAKSAGGTDDLGFKWLDIKPQTKAYSRPDARRGISLPGPKYRPTLTPAQDRVWRGVYARVMHRLKQKGFTTKKERARMSSTKYRKVLKERRGNAANTAAGAAWNFVKDKLGAITLIDVAGQAQVPIMQDSHRLIDSLEPAPLTSNGSYSATNPDQLVRSGSPLGASIEVPNSSLFVGTRVPYAKDASKARPIWPANQSEWIERAMRAGSAAASKHLADILRGAA